LAVLRTLIEGLAARPEVTGVALVSPEGLLIDHALPAALDGDALAALATTVLRQMHELGSAAGRGSTASAVIEFQGGPALVGAMEKGAALVVLASAEADLGDLLYLIRRYRPAVTDAL
jgi:predicted regulator of Ras-like GTPase activity (Roadblock/LC7/MglB family)